MTAEQIKDLMASSSECTYITLIDIWHKELGTVLHFCNNTVDITYDGDVYTAASFTFDPPDNKSGESGSSKLSICIVDQQLIGIMLSLSSPPSLMAHTILNTSENVAEKLEEWEFKLRNISWDSLVMTGDLIYETYLDTAVPSKTFDLEHFPGCF